MWHVTIAFTSTLSGFTEDAALEVLDELVTYGAAVSPHRDSSGGEIMLSIEAETARNAIDNALEVVVPAVERQAGHIEIVNIESASPDVVDERLKQPIFPEVVGYAEIAEMTGKSRQRARQWAQLEGFPPPVITTAQGPLMAKAAVTAWLEQRDTSPGRRRSAGGKSLGAA